MAEVQKAATDAENTSQQVRYEDDPVCDCQLVEGVSFSDRSDPYGWSSSQHQFIEVVIIELYLDMRLMSINQRERRTCILCLRAESRNLDHWYGKD